MFKVNFTSKQKFQGVAAVGLGIVLVGLGGYLLYAKNHQSSASFTPTGPVALTNSTEISLNIQEDGKPASGVVSFGSATCDNEFNGISGTVGGTAGFFWCTSETGAIQFSDITFQSDTANGGKGATYTIVPATENTTLATVPAGTQLVLDAVVGEDPQTGNNIEETLREWIDGAWVDTQNGTFVQE